MGLAPPSTEVQAGGRGLTGKGRGCGHSLAHGRGLRGGARPRLWRSRGEGQREGWVSKARPGSGPEGRGEVRTQLLLHLGNAAGKAAPISCELLPGTSAGSLGWSCPDSQEVDGDFLRKAHLDRWAEARNKN